MSEIRRYGISMDFAKCHIKENGEFVEFTDYESERLAHEQTCKELNYYKEELGKLVETHIATGNKELETRKELEDLQDKLKLLKPEFLRFGSDQYNLVKDLREYAIKVSKEREKNNERRKSKV
jgi:hypothetical protein